MEWYGDGRGIKMVVGIWEDVDADRWEELPITFNMGFPYVQYINHDGWVFKYTFSINTKGQFLVINVVRVYDQQLVFHGRMNEWDYVVARDPITKRIRFFWVTREINIDEQIAVIYAFHIPEWIK